MSVELLLRSLPITEEVKERFASDIRYVERFLADRHITVSESVAYMFYNHLYAFLQRLFDGKCSQLLEEEDVRDQLTEPALQLASELAGPLFQKYGTEESRCEEVLLATYFVMLLEK